MHKILTHNSSVFSSNSLQEDDVQNINFEDLDLELQGVY